MLFIEKGEIDVLDSAFVVIDKNRGCAPIFLSAVSPV